MIIDRVCGDKRCGGLAEHKQQHGNRGQIIGGEAVPKDAIHAF